MINLDIRPHLDVILTKGQIDWLLSKLFEIHVGNLSRISRRIIFKEEVFSDLLVFSNYLEATNELQKEGLIESSIADLVKQTLWKVFNNLDQYRGDEEESRPEFSDHEIEEHAKFIKFFHLALLATFKNIELLGRKKRQKLSYLFANSEKRREAIQVKRELTEKEKAEKKSSLEPYTLYEGYVAPEFAVANFGMYDKRMNDFVKSTLIIPNYATNQLGKNGTLYLQLTDRGWNYIQELLERDKDFRTFINIARELQPYFDNMTGSELITFLKKYIVLDWDEHKFWSKLE